jgi:hypothetical protein
MNIRKILAALAVPAAAVTLSAAPAAAAAHPAPAAVHQAPVNGNASIPGITPDGGSWALCDFKGTPVNKCMEDDGPFADLLNEPFAGHVVSQRMAFGSLATSVCNGGHVTSTCPFDVGSGNNTTYLGDGIYQLLNFSSANCMQATTPGGAVRDSGGGCGGVNGTNWVHDGTWSFVGVYATNHQANDDPEYLTGGSAGTTVKVHDGFVEGYSQWGGES